MVFMRIFAFLYLSPFTEIRYFTWLFLGVIIYIPFGLLSVEISVLMIISLEFIGMHLALILLPIFVIKQSRQLRLPLNELKEI